MPLPTSSTTATPLPPSVEKAYYRKCIELKRRLNEVEEANDAARLRRARLDRAVLKMRLERAFLLEQLGRRMAFVDEEEERAEEEAAAVAERDAAVAAAAAAVPGERENGGPGGGGAAAAAAGAGVGGLEVGGGVDGADAGRRTGTGVTG